MRVMRPSPHAYAGLATTSGHPYLPQHTLMSVLLFDLAHVLHTSHAYFVSYTTCHTHCTHMTHAAYCARAHTHVCALLFHIPHTNRMPTSRKNILLENFHIGNLELTRTLVNYCAPSARTISKTNFWSRSLKSSATGQTLTPILTCRLNQGSTKLSSMCKARTQPF